MRAENRPRNEIMRNTADMDFLSLADVLNECSSLEIEEKFPDFAELPPMDMELTNLDECTEFKQLTARDFLYDDAYVRKEATDECSNELQELQDIMTLTHPGDLLVPMWNPNTDEARDSIISEVMLQIEVSSETNGYTVQDVSCNQETHSPGSTGEFSDYTSDSGSDQSVMDLSITSTRFPYPSQTRIKEEVQYVLPPTENRIIKKHEPFHIPSQDFHNRFNGIKTEYHPPSPQSTIPSVVTSHPLTDSGGESAGDDSDESNTCKKVDRKRPGRKKGQVSKVYHLWEFIRDMLADPVCCPKVIKWENREEGIFRVVQSEQMAAMWGKRKNNRTKMTYEKMSRSIRYSRKEGYFADIPKDRGYPKKLCFKFGAKSHGWDLAKS